MVIQNFKKDDTKKNQDIDNKDILHPKNETHGDNSQNIEKEEQEKEQNIQGNQQGLENGEGNKQSTEQKIYCPKSLCEVIKDKLYSHTLSD